MKVLLLAGEPSGDRMGAGIAQALRAIDPGVELLAMGSDRLRAAGVTTCVDSSGLAVVGLTEVIGVLPALFRARSRLRQALAEFRPDVVVPIDYPDFNLAIARDAAHRRIPVAWLVSPQVWAWRPRRVLQFAQVVSRMLVLFPFEVETWRRAGVPVEHVGHPLVDLAQTAPARTEARASLGLGDGETVIALLPGSRRKEVRHVGPNLARAADIVATQRDVKFLVPVAPGLDPEFVRAALPSSSVTLTSSSAATVIAACDAAAVASGTATLETALAGTPLVACYRVSGATMLLSRRLADPEFLARGRFSLPNLVLESDAITELYQERFTAEAVAEALVRLLPGGSQREAVLAELARLPARLGGTGAFERIARAVIATGARRSAEAGYHPA